MAFSTAWLHSEWLHNNRDTQRAPLISKSLLRSLPEHGQHVLRRMSAGDVAAAASQGGYSNAHNDLGEGAEDEGHGVAGYVSHCPCEEYQRRWAARPVEGYDWRVHVNGSAARSDAAAQQARL
eukprot:COSAG06_NODE_4251_length_4429_cov_50.160970_3_plen_123_part_00